MRCRLEEEEDAAGDGAEDFKGERRCFICLDLMEQDLQEWVQ